MKVALTPISPEDSRVYAALERIHAKTKPVWLPAQMVSAWSEDPMVRVFSVSYDGEEVGVAAFAIRRCKFTHELYLDVDGTAIDAHVISPEEWLGAVERLARGMDIDVIQFESARAGFERAVKPLGFEVVNRVYRKELG